MSSCWGQNIRISVFGQSHSASIGVVIDGLPAGFCIDMEELRAFMLRRAPGRSKLSTSRSEADKIEFVSGLAGNVLCGAPLCAMIRNTDVRPGDYSEFSDSPRPGHADFTAEARYRGFQDASGGGHFSGRLTAPLCVAGGICLQILASGGIRIGAHIQSILSAQDRSFDPVNVSEADLERLLSEPLTVIEAEAGAAMAEQIEKAAEVGDSVGGIIECVVLGLPSGIGDPMFDGVENRIASIVFGIPAIKGIEFGSGFRSAHLRGSQNNDPFVMHSGAVRTTTNNHGGILGGITSGMPIIFRAAIKPTPSISLTQQTVSLKERRDTQLNIKGRHDPCIVPRAVPCIEAAAALAVCDLWLPGNYKMD